jgi:hypothetical protein
MNNIYKLCLTIVASTIVLSCSDEAEIAPYKQLIFSEGFSPESPDFNFNGNFNFPGWINFAETGTRVWTEREFNDDGYIQFNPFGSGQASNIGWAITPAIDLDSTENEALSFTSATNFVDNPANKLEVLISSDFDGTNVLSATWTILEATVANETTNGYVYIPSGEIDLSSYSGTVHIAFRVTGDGSTLDGLFQVDKIKVYENN